MDWSGGTDTKKKHIFMPSDETHMPVGLIDLWVIKYMTFQDVASYRP